MKITAVRPILTGHYLFVRVDTDAGLTGNGECGLWSAHRPTAEAVRQLGGYFVGQDPRRIEHHTQAVTRTTHFFGAVLQAALSGIDMALWDILGQSLGVPVYQLLGGKTRERVRVFDNINGHNLEERVASAKAGVEAGFTVLRTTPFYAGFEQKTSTRVIDEAIEMIGAIRDAIGYGTDLGVEIHRNLQPDEAITLAKGLEPFRLKFYEDPLAPQSDEALRYIARHIDIPMALGERSFLVTQFKELIDDQVAAFIRPDVSLAGGFTQLRKIAAIAEPAFVQLFPHLMGGPVNNAAFAHLAAAIPNYYVTEVNGHTPEQLALVKGAFATTAGFREVPERPGLGIEIDEAACAEVPFVERGVRHSLGVDGSVAH